MRPPYFAALHVRVLFLCFAVPFLIFAWWWATPHLIVPVSQMTQSVSGSLVVIDPGHGGADPGAVGQSGLLEKDVVLWVANSLEPLLNRVAVYTRKVRDGDYDLAQNARNPSGSRKTADLRERVTQANEVDADLYISLHANSFPSPRWSGAQTFYYPGKEEGRRLAESIQRRLVEAFPENRRTARPGEYFVLRETEMPAVVVEIGFLSNPQEEELLATPDHQRKLADAIYRGIVDFLAHSPASAQREARAVSVEPVEKTLLTPETAADEFLLYFGSAQETSAALAAVAATYPRELVDAPIEQRISHVLRSLIAGPNQGSSLLPTLPRETKLLKVDVTKGQAIIDLSREVRTRFWGGSRSEELLINSLVRTVGQFAQVQEVILLVEGRGEGTLAGHVDIGAVFPVPRAPTRP